jgi:CRP/FNR family transcriptional regulator
MTIADELRALVPGIQALPDSVAERLGRLAVEQRYAAGMVLYREGDVASGLYIILSGKVRVSRDFKSRSHVLHSEGAGGVLGEIPVFGGGAFPATAVAIEPTRCMHLPADAVERILRDEPSFARFALRRIAIRARSLLHRIDELTAKTITARVAEHVLGRADSGSGEITLGMSQEALAAELGTAREVVVRALAALVAAGAIERTGRSRFTVRRLALLRAIASG